jgi:osmotically-inducible protein OsmY
MSAKNLLTYSALGVAVMSQLTGCFSPVISAVSMGVQTGLDPRDAETVVTDKALGTKLSANLLNEYPQASFTTVAYDHEVLLAGQVPDKMTEKSAVEFVSKTDGVKLVYNYLTIGPNQSPATITTDTYLTSRAKAEIINTQGVKQINTKVVSCNGVVYILGKNPATQQDMNQAINAIKQIDGVKSVVNLISSYKPESDVDESKVS